MSLEICVRKVSLDRTETGCSLEIVLKEYFLCKLKSTNKTSVHSLVANQKKGPLRTFELPSIIINIEGARPTLEAGESVARAAGDKLEVTVTGGSSSRACAVR